jgi:cyclopropane fatty-acyl-phospholipid synthase-like methyltransferase
MKVLIVSLMLLASAVVAAQQHKPAQPDQMQHKFDDPAQYAKSFDDPARDKWQMPDRVIGALNLKAGMSVADIGAGTGYFTARLAKVAGVSVLAADIEPKMVEYLKNRAITEKLSNVTAVLAGATSPNLPQPVDVVLVVDTYHHLPNRPAYFRDLRKSLKAGGRVAIVDFRKDAPDGPPVQFRFTPEQIEAEMKEAGYQLEASHDFLPRQHYMIFR